VFAQEFAELADPAACLPHRVDDLPGLAAVRLVIVLRAPVTRQRVVRNQRED
jgi:hypothetical protein